MTRLVPVLVSALFLSLGVAGGTAYAYFSATGSGTGHSAVGELRVSVEAATVTPSALLFPGYRGGLSLEIRNPNGFPLTLTGVAQDGPVIVTGPPSSCTSDTGAWPAITEGTSGVSVSTTSTVAGGLNDRLAPDTVTTVTVPTGSTMAPGSNSTCQTKSFHVDVTVTVRS